NGFGGGVYVAAGTVIVSASRITHNRARGGDADDGGTDGLGVGGGVYNLGTFLFDAATIIPKNHASHSYPDCFGVPRRGADGPNATRPTRQRGKEFPSLARRAAAVHLVGQLRGPPPPAGRGAAGVERKGAYLLSPPADQPEHVAAPLHGRPGAGQLHPVR